MKSNTLTIRLLATAVAVSLMGGAVLAQQPSGESGRALDANPGINSGGVNNVQGRIDYRLRNDLITGNVVGGDEFRGEIGYSAPGEFLGVLESDALFGFRRQSFFSAPSNYNLAPMQQPIIGFGASVYRSYTTVPATRIEDALSSGVGIAPESGAFRLYRPGTIGGGTPLLSTQLPLEALQPGDTLGRILQPDGRTLEITASPLLGIRQRAQVPTPPVKLDDSGLTAPPQLVPEEGEAGQEIPPNIYSPAPTDQELEPGEPETAPVQIGTTLLVGRELQAQQRLGGEPMGAVAEQRIGRIEGSLYQRLQREQAQPGESVYLDLLTAMREREERAGREPSEEPQLELAEPSETLLEQVERQRREAVRRATGQEGAEEQAEGEAEVSGPLARLLEQLDYDLPRLETLAGIKQDRLNQSLKQAEQAMAAGQFFTAEALYRQATNDAPADPLPQIGLVHAQLGAGMIRSAAHNLRGLFERHPELIAARYGENLLPNQSRLKWIQGELDRMISSGESTVDPGLMMAYLGYQVDSQPLIRYGLAVAESQAPRDPLLPVLRKIWMEPQNGSSNSGTSSEETQGRVENAPPTVPSTPDGPDGK
jgi:hypothetical protein